ncbi:tyrosine-type recombinase/integrase [Kitasatospora sp. NPDC003701]|nr:tyrosine-type recombinase/integrase [Kitasatospora purpeofusca]
MRQEVHPDEDGKRRTFRRSGFSGADAAQKELDHVRALLALAPKDDPETRRVVSDMIMSCIRTKSDLPDVEETSRKVKAGHSLITVITVGEWLDTWLAGRKKLRPTGTARYETDIRVHLKPHVGALRLDRLRVEHLDTMFESINDTNEEIVEQNAQRRQAVNDLKLVVGRAARRVARAAIAEMPPFRRVTGLSTQQHIRATLRAALNVAIARQLITFNPAAHVELETAPKPKALVWTAARIAEWRRTGLKPSPVMIWTPAQAGHFLDFVEEHRLYALWHLYIFRGPRRGEGVGARWVDFDQESQKLTVETTLVQLNWEVLEGTPKTTSGSREVSLDGDTTGSLVAHRHRQKLERLKWGPAWVDTGRIFTAEDGTWLHPAWVSEEFQRLTAAAGLPPVRLHDLRHLAATLALLAGVDIRVVSEMLGHSDTSITRDTYQTVLSELARDAAEAVVALVPRRRRTVPGAGAA